MQSNKPKNLDKQKIIDLYKKGICISEIARIFNCRTNAIQHHIGCLSVPYYGNIKRNCKLKYYEVKQIRKKYIYQKIAAPILAKEYNVSETTILNVVNGIFYRWVDGVVKDKDGIIHVIPKKNYTEERYLLKGKKKPGAKEGSTKKNSDGSLIKLAKKYKVSTSTICKWIKKGKIKL